MILNRMASSRSTLNSESIGNHRNSFTHGESVHGPPENAQAVIVVVVVMLQFVVQLAPSQLTVIVHVFGEFSLHDLAPLFASLQKDEVWFVALCLDDPPSSPLQAQA